MRVKLKRKLPDPLRRQGKVYVIRSIISLGHIVHLFGDIIAEEKTKIKRGTPKRRRKPDTCGAMSSTQVSFRPLLFEKLSSYP